MYQPLLHEQLLAVREVECPQVGEERRGKQAVSINLVFRSWCLVIGVGGVECGVQGWGWVCG